MFAPRSPARRRRPPRVEELERRDLLAGLAPTPLDQQMLEELNDIRANPPAYSDWAGVDLSGDAPAQPLAFNPLLIAAAQGHSQDMNDHNLAGHVGSDGSGPTDRIRAAGFPEVSDGESVAVGPGMTPDAALAGLIQDFGQPDLGHRRHLLAIDDVFKPQNQVGIGIVVNGTGTYHNYYTLDTAQDADPRPFLTGVVYNDANGDGHYEAGEGLAGVTITVAGVGSFPACDTGGYSIRLGPGTYTVTAAGGRMAAPVTTTVTVGPTNYRLNFVGQNVQTWAPVPLLPTARSYLAAATGGDGRVYALGGEDSKGQALDTAEAYDPTTGKWAGVAPLPTARTRLAAVAGPDGRVYVLGGGAGGTLLDSVDVYDPAANQWTTLTSDPMPHPVAQPEAALGPDHRIYVFGGSDASGNTQAAVQVFDPAAPAGQRWSTLPDMPFGRFGGGAATGPDGNIYLAGGEGPGGFFDTTTRVDVFTPAGDSWGRAPDLPEARSDVGVVIGADGRIYTVGGGGIPGTSSVQAFQPGTGSWATVAELTDPRARMGVALGPDGRIYALGGILTVGTPGILNFGPSPAAEALPTAAGLAPVSSFGLVSYPGPLLPHGVTPGRPVPVPVTSLTDVTAQVTVTRGALRRQKGLLQQALTLRNGGAPLPGPIALVFDHLARGIKLRHQTGVLRGRRRQQSPYLYVTPGAGVLGTGAVLTVTVQFSGARPHYALRVLAPPRTS